jgi:hypothetical protein
MNLKEIGKVLMSKSVGTGPSSYEKRIYWAAVSQRFRSTGLETGLQAASVLLVERTYFSSSQKCVNYMNTLHHDRVVSLNLQVTADESECWKQIPLETRNF